MAFYEMLPGAGMPPGLQAGMDSVLNKKFGTSTTYPAEDWPDTVNLMGPLPEKTASGAIVTFADGADAVPLKKCEITLPASLDGYSEVDVVSAGKNLWSFGDQTITTTYTAFTLDTPIPAGTYTVSTILSSTHTNADMRFRKEDGSAIIVCNLNAGSPDRTSKKITLPEPAYNIYLYAAQGGTGNTATWKDVQIEAGETMTDFTPYTAPTTHTASLGRTIYGGTADIVNRQGTGANSEPVTFVGASGENWQYSVSGTKQRVWIHIADAKSSSNKLAGNIIAPDSIMSGYPDEGKAWVNSSKSLVIGVPSSITSASDWKTYLSNNNLQVTYELATPETFTFDPVPIDSKLGNNTLWSEQGSDTEVTYRADINLALGGN